MFERLLISRRKALKDMARTGSVLALAALPSQMQFTRGKAELVRDRLWVWAHPAGAFNGSYGLPGESWVTPADGAAYLGVRNVVFIRDGDRPQAPFENYANQFRSLDGLMWSVVAGTQPSDADRQAVLTLAENMPNMKGVFMDDFFLGDGTGVQWLAESWPVFPVTLTLRFLTGPVALTRIELTQSDWPTSEFHTADFAIDTPLGDDWKQAAVGRLDDSPSAQVTVALPGEPISSLRLRLLSSYDTQNARSVGLRRIRAWAGTDEVPLHYAAIQASSTYSGAAPTQLLTESVPGVLSVDQLRALRASLRVGDRRLDLGVTLYDFQIDPLLRDYLELCDVISLWTWKSVNLGHLEENLARLKQIVPDRRIMLGCYMWDYEAGQPLSIGYMYKQVELGLQWIKSGQIKGMIFLETNLCGRNLDVVNWTRLWIAEVGNQPLLMTV